MEVKIVNHNYMHKGTLATFDAHHAGRISLLALLGTCLFCASFVGFGLGQQKMPTPTPQKPQVEIEKKTGVGINGTSVANIFEAEIVDKIAKNIHKELDGHVVGYSFVVGDLLAYEKSDGYGHA